MVRRLQMFVPAGSPFTVEYIYDTKEIKDCKGFCFGG